MPEWPAGSGRPMFRGRLWGSIMTAAATKRCWGLSVIAVFGANLAMAQADAPREVRQIVTFQFAPGRMAEAVAIYRDQLRPIYNGIPALLRFRGFSESESPEPLDLIVVSSYRGMAGMDLANEGLRRPGATGASALSLYGTLSAMTVGHHDQFVEIVPSLSDSAGAGGLTVFEYVRLAPGSADEFERLLHDQVRPFEREHQLVVWSETGRMLVSDGWDYLRIFGIRTLADWQRYQQVLWAAPFRGYLQHHLAARKTLIVRDLPNLAVR